MGYQALLFCPDEKTARSVTQVLSELDFSVIPCTEPFAAVKKLMGEHFDAIVVDCDNEQNATLLFKSARNTPTNQSSLAVAVVEGQAGVAKAFRIGANLVLTKPINVEQAKGTLRVARGLLRKSEGGKPAAPAAGATVATAKPAPTPAKPAPQVPNTRVATPRPAPPVAPLATAATASIPTQKPAPQPRVVASVPTEITESDAEILDVSDQIAPPSIARPAAGFGSSAASAPAPAREPKPAVATEDKSSAVIAEPGSTAGKVADLGEGTASSDGTSAPAPSFTFGGNVSSDKKPAGGHKKAVLAVAAVVLIAAGGYALWMQWVRSSGAATPFTHVAAQPVTAPAAVSRVAPSRAPVGTSSATSSAASSAASSVQSSTPDSATAPRSTGTAETSSDSNAPDAESEEDAPAHPSKVNSKADPGKTASASAANKAPAIKAEAQPIVIKNGLSKPVAKPATLDAPAPSMTGIAPADDGGSLPNLMGSDSQAPTPVLQTLNVSQGVSQGLLVKKVQPIYPANALRMRVEGAVDLMATISKTGDISAVKILKGDPTLARAAVDAVKQWKYKPYLLNGEPVEIQTQITTNFKLPH
ncbi:MAG: TonB family protein [Candidatus Sulfotelmatobacter sp.]